jgi:hypothetical protein
MKRMLVMMLASLSLLAGCTTAKREAADKANEDPLQRKFRGIYGVVLRIDATSRKNGVVITSETGRNIDSPSLLSLDKVDNLTYTDNSMPSPRTVRATWRTGEIRYVWGGGWEGGTIVGDYTFPVAERIPDAILDDIRKNGGALRVKIRLADDGILIGWDIERRVLIPNCKRGVGETCRAVRYFLPGGDFCERDPSEGWPGWQNKTPVSQQYDGKAEPRAR